MMVYATGPRPLDKKLKVKNYFSYFFTKTYVVGTQKNSLSETVLLSTQNTCFNSEVEKNYNLMLKKVCPSEPWYLP